MYAPAGKSSPRAAAEHTRVFHINALFLLIRRPWASPRFFPVIASYSPPSSPYTPSSLYLPPFFLHVFLPLSYTQVRQNKSDITTWFRRAPSQ